tara:strand:+ start:234 stop:401 length:168 start_codon:yes stop_codon:yes gene_type:complete
MIKSLVIDKAQSLAQEHVQEAIDRNLSDDQKHVLDAVVDAMPDNSFKSVKDFLNG